MPIEDSKRTIAAYDALLARAVAIVENPPYDKFLPDGPYIARLDIVGDTAILSTSHYASENDYLPASRRFSAHLLTVSDAELAAWQARAAEEMMAPHGSVREAAEREEANRL